MYLISTDDFAGCLGISHHTTDHTHILFISHVTQKGQLK